MANAAAVFALIRTASALVRDVGILVIGGLKLRKFFFPHEVQDSRLYNSSEVAKLLGTDRKSVIRLVNDGKLQAQMINGNFKILGDDIKTFFSHKHHLSHRLTASDQDGKPNG